MNIAGERAWCGQCTAPVVLEGNVPIIGLFLDALPGWQSPGLCGGGEGLRRAEVLALMDLHGIAPTERPEHWAAIADLEGQMRSIFAERREEQRGQDTT